MKFATFIRGTSFSLATCLSLLFALPLRADEASDIKALVDSFDKLWIEEQTYAEIKMVVKTSRYQRELKMHYWGKGQDKSLVRITFPPKEKGVSTLRFGQDVYNFVPKIARTTKISDALMSQSWMGSHLTNGDLMRTNRLSQEYQVKLLEKKKGADGGEIWILEALAKPETASLHRRLLIHFDRKTKLPTEQHFFDREQKLLRVFTYSDVKTYAGKLVPSRVHVAPALPEQKGEFTDFIYEKIDRKKKISDDTFNLTQLSDI